MCNLLKHHPSVGILTYYPSVAPFGFTLGPTNPWLNTIAKETSNFRWSGLSPDLRLLRPTFSLLCAPPSVTLRLHCSIERFPTNHSHHATRDVLNLKFEIYNLKYWDITVLLTRLIICATIWTVTANVGSLQFPLVELEKPWYYTSKKPWKP